jgi:hypothetical protein
VRRGSAAFFFRILVLALGLWSAAAGAATGPYTGQVPVASQSDADRIEGLKAALSQVVVRVSGDAAAPSRPDVAKAIAQAERYVQQYQYQQDVVSDNGQPQQRLILVAEFDHDAVDRLLRGAVAAADATPGAAAPPIEAAPQAFQVWVGGVRSADDYARLIAALSGNDYIHDTRVEMARGDGVELRLTTVVPLARVLESINAGTVLRVTNAKPPVDGIDALLDLKP